MTQNHLDTYLDLCTQAYDLSKPTPPDDAYAFYKSYVMDAKGPILEPMCGTGRFLLPLLKEGFDIEGFDASEHMLRALFEKAEKQNLKPNVWQGFVADLKKEIKYGLIFIPGGSFGLLTDHTDAVSALEIFYEHLADDGVLVLEGETIKSTPECNVERQAEWSKPNGDIIRLKLFTTLDGSLCTSLCKYELIKDNTVVHSEQEDIVVKLYEPDTIVNMLREVGFHAVKTLKAFDRNAVPEDDAEVIVYECRK